MKIHPHFPVLLIVYSLSLLNAQIKIHKTISIEEGLIQSQVTCIYKDTKGYLWFGTLGGLSRWDGIDFLNYNLQDGLSSPLISAIIEGEQGELYICTNGGGINILKDGKFDTLSSTDGLADNRVYAALQSRDGKIYFGTAAGISIYSGKRFSTFDESKGLSNNRVTSIHENKDGTIYFSTANGVTLYKNGKIKIISTKDGLTGDKVTCVREGDDGTLYFSTWGDGVTVFKQGKYYPLKKEHGLSENLVYTMESGKDNKIYFGTWGGGVNIFENGKIKKISGSEGLENNYIMSVYEDDNEVAYIGTDGGGISIYNKEKLITWNASSGLAEMNIRAIYKSRGGDIYFGTDGSGVTIFTGGKIIQVNEKNGLLGNSIRCFYEIKNGEILVGTFGGGISVIKNGKIISRPLYNIFRGKRIKTIYEDLQGNLLIGTYNEGIYFLKNDGIARVLNKQTGLSSNFINTIYQGGDSTYYFGTWGGLNIFRNNNISLLDNKNGLSNNYVNAVYGNKRKKIYIGTDGGLNIFDREKIEILTTKNGLSDNTILGILEDESGNIYISTNRGINILDFSNGKINIRTIKSTEGLASDECNQSAVYKDESGGLWFGTTKGATRFDPKMDMPNLVPPVVHISKVRIFDNDIKFAGIPRLALTYDQNYIKFDFIGLNLPATNKVIYRYRLSGIDKKWLETNLRYVQYTNLDDGKYTFELAAMNEWGVWSKPKFFYFVISPPFWKTWWFRLILIFAVIALVWFFYKMRVNKLIEIERMRLRIASNLHDDIGATLTRISVNSEIIKHNEDKEKIREAADKIGVLSREVTQTMSDIVWSIDSRNDTIDDLISRMKDYAYHVLSPKNILFKFSHEGINLSKKMNIDMKQNIYLIFKEAVNNSAKHSCADAVEVKMKNESDHFTMVIKDNGKGLQSKGKKGHGLKNISMRTESIGGTAEFIDDSGFEIRIKTKSI
jgi:ligand-binding sensor domain-containing protein/two-component sensor histidine kinase